MEPFFKYYIVQVETAFVANNYCDCDLTHDEEEAYAFTSLVEAQSCAGEVEGTVLVRTVSERELAELEQNCEDTNLQQFCLQLAELS